MIEYLGQPGIGIIVPASDSEADYVRVANDLREKIRTVGSFTLEGQTWVLEPGAQLPTKIQLMAIYGVTGGIIDTAMVLLREWGFVVGRQGRGRFVAEGKDDLRPT